MTLEDIRVLIVDDNGANRRLLQAIVNGLGVGKVDIAVNGVEGLESVARAKPDLILLDVMMPEMNGYEMCRHLRASHGHDDLPVLFVTAMDQPEERSACFAAGGTDMVTKPINTAEITARLKVHLENRMLLAGLKSYQARLRDELDMAHRTQEALHPDARQLADIQDRTGVAIRGLVETSSELGGDFWTVFETQRGTVGLLVADFTGHGVAAAFNAVRLHALMSRRPHGLGGPADLLDFLNHELNRLLPLGQFAAALACELDPETGALTCAGALTPPPMLIEPGGIRPIALAGAPLGAFTGSLYDEVSTIMAPGSTLFIHSDALLESTLEDGSPVITEDELVQLLAQSDRAGDLGLAVRDLFHRRRSGPPPDDLTLVTLTIP
jgi:sigma-B regulation protein RsbU (phosphoserine phosphatase)